MRDNMSKYNIVMEMPNATVVSKYESEKNRSDAYQSEAALEKEFIRMLTEQGYEYLTINDSEALVKNLRTQLELLNDYKFTENEWNRFFNNNIANNNEGIVGIAPNVKLYSYSVYIRNAPNVDQELATSVSLAANSVDVISCSWGSNGVPSSLIKDAIKYNVSWGRNGKGSVIVFAAGNENSNIDYPANCGETLISVGAINKNGTRANFSNYGLELDVVAPGVSIPTCDLLGSSGDNNTNYCLDFNGTSAACPHVAAVAALMLSVNPNLTSSEVEQIITQTARKVGGYNYSLVTGKNNGTWHQEMGYGLVNAYAAVQEAINRNN